MHVRRAAQESELKKWHKNVLRHSWISYKLADTGDAAQVASWAGTSREKIFKNYRALRTLDGLPVTQELAGSGLGLFNNPLTKNRPRIVFCVHRNKLFG
jgi:hypothetical protein